MPLFWILDNSKKAFLYGWLFGMGLAAGQMWWIVTQNYPLRPFIRFLLIAGVVLLVAFLGLFQGLFASVTKRLGLWSAPLALPAVEMLRELTDIAFPWELLGYSVTPWPLFTQTASLWGVYGLGSVIMLVNVSLYKLIKEWADRKLRLRWSLALAGTVLFVTGFGAARLLSVQRNSRELKVALLQPNIPTVMKGSLAERDSLVNAMLDQTRDAEKGKPDLILYPETATLADLTRPSRYTDGYLRLADSIDIPVATGIIYWVQEATRWRFANSATVIDKDGRIGKIYIKIRLAPFGETIPFENVLPFLAKIDVQGGHHYRGKEYVVYEDAPVPLSFLICYESIFPLLTRNFVHKGARLLCNVTNDVWFGQAEGPRQHAEMAVLRSVENGVPLIRAANNGISMIVDPYGRVLKQSPLMVKTIVEGKVPLAVGPTIYTVFGFLFPYIAAAAVISLLVVKRVRKGGRTRQQAAREQDSPRQRSQRKRRSS